MNLLRRTARHAGSVLMVAGLLVAASAPASAADKAKIIGSGSTFSQLLLDQWRSDTRSKPYSLDVNYQGTGSTQGRQSFLQKTVDFAGSDIPYQPGDEGVPPAGSFRYITAVAGALGMMFNITDDAGSRVTDLTLTPEQVCRVFTEQLVTGTAPFWDELVPGQGLPHVTVKPVVRGDGSGTSYVLSEFCIATAPSVWAAFRTAAATNFNSNALSQGRPISTWPAFPGAIAGTGSTGIAGFVSATEASANGRITYIEAGYTEITQLPLAKVTNAAGVAVEPTPGAITSALSHATIRGDGTFQLHFDDPDQAAYYPSTYSYLIVPSGAGAGADAGKGRTLAEYVYYALTFGQDQAEPLKFARLSTNLIADGLAAAAALNGAPTFEAWSQAVGWNKAPTDGGQQGGGSTGGGAGGTGSGGTGGGGTGGGGTGGGGTGGGGGGGSGQTGEGGGQTVANQAEVTGTTTTVAGDGAVGVTTTVPCTTTSTAATTTTSAAAAATSAASSTSAEPGATSTTIATTTTTDPCTPGASAAAKKTGPTTTAKKGAAPAAASPGGSTAAASAAGPAKAPGPSNAEAVWTVLQGAAVLGAGLVLRRSLGGARA